jgi:hypothetical protein
MASNKRSKPIPKLSLSERLILQLENQLLAANSREDFLRDQINKLQSLLSIKQFSPSELARPARRAPEKEPEADPMFAPDARVFDETHDGKLIRDGADKVRAAKVASQITEEEMIEHELDELAEEVGGMERVIAAPATPPPPTEFKGKKVRKKR